MALDKENNLSGGVCSRSANRVRQELATVLRRWEEVSSGHLVEDMILSPSWRYPLSCIAPRLKKKTDHWQILFISLHYVWQLFFMFMNQTCWSQHRKSHLLNIIPVIFWVWLRLRHNPTYFWWLSLMWENIGPVWIAWDGNPTNWSTDWLPPKDKFQTFFFTGNIFLFI